MQIEFVELIWVILLKYVCLKYRIFLKFIYIKFSREKNDQRNIEDNFNIIFRYKIISIIIERKCGSFVN